MAAGKYGQWRGADALDKVTNWAAHGCTDAEIASNMGISRSTFYDWIAKYPDISDAVKKGRGMSVECIENKLFQAAVGEVWEETEVAEKWADGSEHVKRTKKKLAPNVTAIIFYLKNRAGYRDNPPQDISDTDVLKNARALLSEVPSAID